MKRAINLPRRKIQPIGGAGFIGYNEEWTEHDIDSDHEAEIKFHQRMLDNAWNALEDEINQASQ